MFCLNGVVAYPPITFHFQNLIPNYGTDYKLPTADLQEKLFSG